jgi:CII-binding regulator of phage lambda lysogenization HflD
VFALDVQGALTFYQVTEFDEQARAHLTDTIRKRVLRVWAQIGGQCVVSPVQNLVHRGVIRKS